MDTKHLLAQELHSLTDPMMSIDIDAEVLPKIRATSADRNVLGDPDRVGVIRTEVQIPAYDSAEPE